MNAGLARPVVYLTGSLGDTLAAVPALWTLRRACPDRLLVLLANRQEGRARVGVADILTGSGVADSFVFYRSHEGPGHLLAKWRGRMELALLLRTLRPDPLVYLIRGDRRQPRVRRDLAFFRLVGVRKIIGMRGMPGIPPERRGAPVLLPRQADQYLIRLAAEGILTPPPGEGRFDIALGPSDFAEAEAWRRKLAPDNGRPWVAFGPGSKMPAKVWPASRFAEVGMRLIREFDIQPVVFGGAEDEAVGRQLLEQWGRGYLAAGRLSVRAAAASLTSCRFYVGNDTGTMHLAASAGIPCVAIFSARDYPGLWDPYGPGHTVLRHDPPCARCGLQVCPLPGHPCLAAISVETVWTACREIFKRQHGMAAGAV